MKKQKTPITRNMVQKVNEHLANVNENLNLENMIEHNEAQLENDVER